MKNIVLMDNCHEANPKESFILVLRKEEEIFSSISKCAETIGLNGAILSGLGAIKNIDIGYYDLEQKKYFNKDFGDDIVELISLTGNIALKDGKPVPHIHIVCSKHDYSAFGGHLFSAKVGVTVEIHVTPLQASPVRQMSEEIGLALICGQV